MSVFHILLPVFGYLSGSLPVGYLLVRWTKGFDIRGCGSGNPGAANIYREVGPLHGLITLLLDLAKGWLPVAVALRFAPGQPLLAVLCGGAAIAGHVWMLFLRFDGGKGVATSAGVFLALVPEAMTPTFLFFAAGWLLSGHISVGSIASAVAFPLCAWAAGAPRDAFLLALCASLLILIKHIPNLRRLAAQYDQETPRREGCN